MALPNLFFLVYVKFLDFVEWSYTFVSFQPILWCSFHWCRWIFANWSTSEVEEKTWKDLFVVNVTFLNIGMYDKLGS